MKKKEKKGKQKRKKNKREKGEEKKRKKRKKKGKEKTEKKKYRKKNNTWVTFVRSSYAASFFSWLKKIITWLEDPGITWLKKATPWGFTPHKLGCKGYNYGDS